MEVDSKYDDIEYLMSRISPGNKVDKWVCFKSMIGSAESVYDSNPNIALNDSSKFKNKSNFYTDGFFHGCMPGYCSYFIVSQKSDSINVINTYEGLKKFIGTIDGLEEAILVSKIKDFDLYTDKGKGRYRRVGRGDQFIGSKYESCPVTRTTYLIEVNISGAIKTQFIDTVIKFTDCIVH